MLNQFQESLIVTEPTKARHPLRLTLVQAAIGLVLVIAISAFGLFTASHASGQESIARKAAPATANVLPDLVIWPESLEPNLPGTFATGDGGTTIEAQEPGGQHASIHH